MVSSHKWRVACRQQQLVHLIDRQAKANIEFYDRVTTQVPDATVVNSPVQDVNLLPRQSPHISAV
jgi:hypothetical protein